MANDKEEQSNTSRTETGVRGNAFRDTGHADKLKAGSLSPQEREKHIADIRKQIRDAAAAVTKDQMTPEEARAIIKNIFSAAASVFPDGMPARLLASVNNRLASVSDEKAKDFIQAASARVTQEDGLTLSENGDKNAQGKISYEKESSEINTSDPLTNWFKSTLKENSKDSRPIEEQNSDIIISAISGLISMAFSQDESTQKQTQAFEPNERDTQQNAAGYPSDMRGKCDHIQERCTGETGHAQHTVNQRRNNNGADKTLGH